MEELTIGHFHLSHMLRSGFEPCTCIPGSEERQRPVETHMYENFHA